MNVGANPEIELNPDCRGDSRGTTLHAPQEGLRSHFHDQVAIDKIAVEVHRESNGYRLLPFLHHIRAAEGLFDRAVPRRTVRRPAVESGQFTYAIDRSEHQFFAVSRDELQQINALSAPVAAA